MKKLAVLYALGVLCVMACATTTAGTKATVDDLRKTRPWIPETSRLEEKNGLQVLVDFVDYKFENDPDVLGTWTSVDFVEKKELFSPGTSIWTGNLFVKSMNFLPGGVMDQTPMQSWTKGHLLSRYGDGNVDESYEIKVISGASYLFREWKSGDYTVRYQKPRYYVFVKGAASARQVPAAPSTTGADDAMFGTQLSAQGKLEIVRRPAPADFTRMRGAGKMTSLPSFDAASGAMWQVDVRSRDLTGLDLAARLADLLHADFDSRTGWPGMLPGGFDPARIMDLGRNPGLGVRGLHAKGITGKGIGIAIIDQALLVDHVEYKDRLRLYEEIHWQKGSEAQMHAPAVASIAVGVFCQAKFPEFTNNASRKTPWEIPGFHHRVFTHGFHG